MTLFMLKRERKLDQQYKSKKQLHEHVQRPTQNRTPTFNTNNDNNK